MHNEAGLYCASGVLILLGNNYVRATFNSANNLRLVRQGGGASFAYTASADPDGAFAFTQGATIDYMQNNLLNLLGLLGGSNANLPLYIKPAAGSAPPPGVYTDQISIAWAWDICPGIGLFGLCVGVRDTGGDTSVISVTVNVTANDITTTIQSAPTWDPINGILAPKSIPGSRYRVTATMMNAEPVDLDSAISIVLPTPAGSQVALDGDGLPLGSVFTMSSLGNLGLAMRYGGPSDSTDDVDFSADGGATWTYHPASTQQAAAAPITHIRVRPRGAVFRHTSVTVSAPYRLL